MSASASYRDGSVQVGGSESTIGSPSSPPTSGPSVRVGGSDTKPPLVSAGSAPISQTSGATTPPSPTSTPKACTHRRDARNLVVCLDGTANQFSEKNTNVVELYSRLVKGPRQLTYYNSGIGTFAKESGWHPGSWKRELGHKLDMAIAWNFKRIVLDAYQWLADNYQDGDRIFLFGFSRGAYQVRVIPGMIERVGLLFKGNNGQIPFAYELYTATTEDEATQPMFSLFKRKPKETEELCCRFKATLSHPDVKVHLVGVWDTVSSIGFAKGASFADTVNGMTHVCVCRHAVALDELRVKFLPEFANGGDGPDPAKSNSADVKEVWFAGTHSDVGGGSMSNIQLDRFGPALRWMTYEAREFGLDIQSRPGKQWVDVVKPTPSLTLPWLPLEILPIERLTYESKEKVTRSWIRLRIVPWLWRLISRRRDSHAKDPTTRLPHFGAPRRVRPGQLVHESVLTAMKGSNYLPLAHIDEGWGNLEARAKGLVEYDPYASASAVMDRLQEIDWKNDAAEQSTIDKRRRALEDLEVLVSTDIGRRSFIENPTALATLSALANALPPDTIRALFTQLAAISPLPLTERPYLRQRLHKLSQGISGLEKDTVERLLANVAYVPFTRHTDAVHELAFFPDGKQIASCSADGTIQVWDSSTGQSTRTLQQSSSTAVRCIAVSSDGAWIVSGGDDHAVRIWSTGSETRSEPRKLTGHTDWISSVAISSDGSRIVSSSGDHTIRIWDTKTGHGRHIVSGSDDTTVRVWDMQTGKELMKLEKHASYVYGVAFSPDGKHIASASRDGTVRLWDSETGAPGRVFSGAGELCFSVAFSPDSSRLVASASEAIYVWDVQTGAPAWSPLRGHTRYVNAVSVSLDGARIYSCSEDTTIRAWSMETGKELKFED